MESFDLAVIGGGPGGYVCAIRAAQLGLKTAVIESNPTLGGTCVNVGCIPSKALLDSSEKYSKALHDFKDHGIQTGSVKIDVAQMMARKDRIVKELTDGLNYLMTKNKITVYRGKGSFVRTEASGTVLAIAGKEGISEITARNVVIATGSEIIRIPGFEPDGETIITSDHAIALKSVPQHLIIIGGGVIGLELGSVWNRLGAKVTVVELLPDILMGMDRQMREMARRTLQKQGIEFLLEHKVVKAEKKKSGVVVSLETTAGEKKSIEGDRLLVAVGRKPYTDGLNSDAVGVKINQRGRIAVDPHTLQTDAPGIYAIGDVIEGAMLAHRAEEEGVKVAELLAGKSGHVNYKALPFIVYTWPEFAWVGQSEEDLQKAGIEYKIGKFLFRPNGRAKAMNEPDGQVKIIADKRTDTILGVFIVGPGASELIAEAVVAVEFGASAEDIARSFHAHPTLSEVMKEAALDVDKRSIHS
ncbi:MAG TPA: dihydrolipoyl dehydrogenase [Leptospiraceae bacterium]|nr:dihydrolipoyl dehydrogenase [Leptospirales bacterium]HMU81717.1 dihydrolipoyl dehydrogenase [Leptospiraceae bacterium]HMX55022.1 dihydrolipoyl dehydrogenase [Leptospiraceae bacterium]HMY44303.1 dihydrolipoyl dehydrogenase [Leptospiraceae bacterium]HNE24578.1 dihydrolipoyl dehydrogenase [Leptospiraceae bacterium]